MISIYNCCVGQNLIIKTISEKKNHKYTLSMFYLRYCVGFFFLLSFHYFDDYVYVCVCVFALITRYPAFGIWIFFPPLTTIIHYYIYIQTCVTILIVMIHPLVVIQNGSVPLPQPTISSRLYSKVKLCDQKKNDETCVMVDILIQN